MEDLVTMAASAASAEVETEVAAAEELCLDTVLLRLQPAVKFPARNAAMSPDRSAGWISLIKLLISIIINYYIRNVPRTVPRQECSNVPRQQCNNVPRQQCRNVPSQECSNVPREQCQDVSLN